MEEKKQINVHVPVSLYDRAVDQARNECTSMSTVVRRAMDEYCGKFETPRGPKLGRRVVQAATAE